tara:strand:- start:57 stop:161 length:105 start_codon:yes stop_codon:yes gene_type:complete
MSANEALGIFVAVQVYVLIGRDLARQRQQAEQSQ